jgi:hypothetical protein
VAALNSIKLCQSEILLASSIFTSHFLEVCVTENIFPSFFLEHGFYSFQDFGSFHEKKLYRTSIYTQCLINYTTVLALLAAAARSDGTVSSNQSPV